MTILQTNSVQPKTVDQYLKLLASVDKAMRRWAVYPVDEATWDNFLSNLFDLMFLEGRPPGDGEKCLAVEVTVPQPGGRWPRRPGPPDARPN